MAGSDSETEPRLPEDLERLIFERVAYEGGDKQAYQLILIARRVHDWIRPFMYRTFIQVKEQRFPDFDRYPLLRLDDVGKYAQRLLAGDDSEAQLDLLLSSCPDIQDLAVWFSGRLSRHLYVLRNTRLTRLSSSLSDLGGRQNMFLNPTFYNLTHLDIVDLPGRKPRWNQWDVLARLPKLSHLLLYDLHIAKDCLIHCKGLKVLIFLRYKMTWLKDILDRVDDERIVGMIYDSMLELRDDWINSVNGGVGHSASDLGSRCSETRRAGRADGVARSGKRQAWNCIVNAGRAGTQNMHNR